MSKFEPEDLTIVVCTLDRPQMLRACLESLIATTPAGVSLAVVFNGSPPNVVTDTNELLRDWSGPVSTAELHETVPLDASHNRGLAMVSTPLVNFMGDDDIVLGPRVLRILRAFNSLEPTPLVVTTFARRIAGTARSPRLGSNKDLGPVSILEWQEWREQGRIFEMLWPGAVIDADALRSIGGFESRFNLATDNWIFSRLAVDGPVVSLRDRNFGYRIHAGSVTASNWMVQHQHVRYVAACYEAFRAGADQPTFEEFVALEQGDSWFSSTCRNLRDRSRTMFRRGAAQSLSGQRIAGLVNIGTAALLWPPAFAEKISDQFGRSDDDGSERESSLHPAGKSLGHIRQ